MPALDKYRKILSILLPAGLIGASFLLSTTALAALPSQAPSAGDVKSEAAPVAERLAAIRDAVSSVAGDAVKPGDLEQLAWWGNGWGNGGWRNGGFANIIPFVAPWGNGWNNWSNWGNGFRNNWGNGGWGNGGWHNWHNY
jgi:hypothetical protein